MSTVAETDVEEIPHAFIYDPDDIFAPPPPWPARLLMMTTFRRLPPRVGDTLQFIRPEIFTRADVPIPRHNYYLATPEDEACCTPERWSALVPVEPLKLTFGSNSSTFSQSTQTLHISTRGCFWTRGNAPVKAMNFKIAVLISLSTHSAVRTFDLACISLLGILPVSPPHRMQSRHCRRPCCFNFSLLTFIRNGQGPPTCWHWLTRGLQVRWVKFLPYTPLWTFNLESYSMLI
jgi:hypothetical protein